MNKPAMIPRLLFLIGTIHWFLFASVFAFVAWIRVPQMNGVVSTVVFALATWSMAREQGQIARDSGQP